jgi:DNA-binding CsgD family transcriptional regulator
MSRRSQLPPRGKPLTDREITILSLVAEGLSTRRIAGEVGIAPFTAKTHLSRIYAKLGVDNRTQAVDVALDQGIIATRSARASRRRSTATTPRRLPLSLGPTVTVPAQLLDAMLAIVKALAEGPVYHPLRERSRALMRHVRTYQHSPDRTSDKTP